VKHHTNMRSRLKTSPVNLPASLKTAGLLICIAAASFGQTLPPGQLPPAPAPPGQLGPPAAKPSKVENPLPPKPKIPPASEASDTSPTFVINRRLVYVPTTVTDNGNYVNGLKSTDFQLFDNDKLQKIESDLTDQPVSAVLVVQANSEVAPAIPKLRKAGVLLQGLVTGQEGDLAILAFDHRMQVLQDFTSDPARIDDAMQKLTAGSSTAALINAVMKADTMLRDHDRQNARRRVIILLSRDVDKGSDINLQEAVHRMQFDNVLVYCVNISKFLLYFNKEPDYPRPAYGGQPPSAIPNLRGNGAMTGTSVVQQQDGNVLNLAGPIYHSIRDLFKKTPADALSVFTRGPRAKVYEFAKLDGLETALTDIGKDINSQYLLTYSPNDSREPGFHTIRVEVNKPQLQITARPGYWAGGGAQQ
jgi:VWFA-related protein